MFDTILNLLSNVIFQSWLVLGQMSPYLLFGFLMAGVLSILFSPEWIERHLGGRGFGPILKAALLGVPLPLCSCGVIPVSASIRRHGASRAATISFLISTPQTGVDSIAVTWGLLGPAFAVFRPLTALVSGLIGGVLVRFFGEKDHLDEKGDTKKNGPCTEICCTERGKRNFVLRALHYSFVTLPRDIGRPLLLGVLIAGVIGAVVPPNEWKPYVGGGILSILMMMAIGIPLYVCATASVPIAAMLIQAGASPGAVLAFLISGPATNAATISTTWKLLGKRTALLYLLTIAMSAVLCGLALDWLMPAVTASLPEFAPQPACHTDKIDWISNAWSIALLLVIALSYFWPANTAAADSHEHNREHERENGEHSAIDDKSETSAERLELQITGMTCSHCTAAVARAIRDCEGVQSVQVDLKTGRAAVEGAGLDSQRLLDAVQSLGYEAKL